MKKLNWLVLFLVLLASCQKDVQIDSNQSNFIENVRRGLKDSLNNTDFKFADFSKSVLSKYSTPSGEVHFVRIPFTDRPKNEFILAQTNNDGLLIHGRIIHLIRSKVLSETEVSATESYNGIMNIQTLNREAVISKTIRNGYWIKNELSSANNFSQFNRENVVQSQSDPYVELPEVIVVGTYTSSGGMSFGTYMSLISMIGSVGYGGYYSNADPWSGGSGGGGGGGGSTGDGGSGSGGSGNPDTNANTPLGDDIMLIDFETQQTDPAIDLSKYLKCFANIPDNGATASIEIFSDLPVDGDPSAFFNYNSQSPGHVFIQLRKENGSQFASQNIGFYPVTGWKTLLSAGSIDGKFVDNESHEFNASFKVNLTPAQLQTAITKILSQANADYDIDDFNCTDWALSVFNNSVPTDSRLALPQYVIPGLWHQSNTPQGLFTKLQQMKTAGGGQAQNIQIPIVGQVGQSSGPCN